MNDNVFWIVALGIACTYWAWGRWLDHKMRMKQLELGLVKEDMNDE